jgi:hypothetical protein
MNVSRKSKNKLKKYERIIHIALSLEKKKVDNKKW